MHKPTILCIDDEQLNLLMLEKALTSNGYDVLQATGGAMALELIASKAPDLVLLDILMPEMDGYEVCRQIKSNSKNRQTPVIMITGLSDRESRIKGIEAGAADFVSKPFDRGELLARIKMLLNMKAVNDRLMHAYDNTNSLIAFECHNDNRRACKIIE